MPVACCYNQVVFLAVVFEFLTYFGHKGLYETEVIFSFFGFFFGYVKTFFFQIYLFGG